MSGGKLFPGKKKYGTFGGWGPTFWFFKSLDINIIYSLDSDVDEHKRNRCTTKVLWV